MGRPPRLNGHPAKAQDPLRLVRFEPSEPIGGALASSWLATANDHLGPSGRRGPPRSHGSTKRRLNPCYQAPKCRACGSCAVAHLRVTSHPRLQFNVQGPREHGLLPLGPTNLTCACRALPAAFPCPLIRPGRRCTQRGLRSTWSSPATRSRRSSGTRSIRNAIRSSCRGCPKTMR